MTTRTDRRTAHPHEHLALFYTDEDELAARAGAYFAEAIRSGGSAVAVATAAHLQAFEGRLEALGVDVGRVRGEGRWLTADANATLAQLLDGDRPDGLRFAAVISPLLRHAETASAPRQPVSVYGEMVGLLWDAGQVTAVLDLERLWNDLQTRVDFRLFCAYPSGPVILDGRSASLVQVCRLHSAVTGAPLLGTIVTRSFPLASDSPRAARWFVTDTLQRWNGYTAILDDAALVVTELATNAVLHARSGFDVEVSRTGSTVRISVVDEGVDLPTPRRSQMTDPSGRGLSLVAELADRWGSEPGGRGKAVWAEFFARASALTAVANPV